MKKLGIRLLFFLLPLLLAGGAAEWYLRHHNTFYQKAAYLKAGMDDFRVLFLGSSHTDWAVNPEVMDIPALNLAHAGSALNLDFALADRFLPHMTSLDILLVELSYHSLERAMGRNFPKNNLFEIYYGIDNYGDGMPWRDRILLLSNPKDYLFILYNDIFYPKRINEAGFLEVKSGKIKSRFDYYQYDTAQIRQTAGRILRTRHNEQNPELLDRYVGQLEDLYTYCRQEGIQLVLHSPPKYYLYNDANIPEKLARRDSVARLFVQRGVPFLNNEHLYEHRVELFANEDHLNTRGAKVYTQHLEEAVRELLDDGTGAGEGSPVRVDEG